MIKAVSASKDHVKAGGGVGGLGGALFQPCLLLPTTPGDMLTSAATRAVGPARRLSGGLAPHEKSFTT